MKGHNIECIAYNSPERINFMKDFFLKMQQKGKNQGIHRYFCGAASAANFFTLKN